MDGGVSAVDGLSGSPGRVAAHHKGLVLYRPGLGQSIQMRNPHKRPLADHEEHVQTLNGHGPGKLGEAHVIADDDAASEAIQDEGACVVAFAEELVLLHRREQMCLVILGHAAV